MNVFNRIIMVLLILTALVLVTGAGFFPDAVIQSFTTISNWMDGIQPRIGLSDRLILIAITVVLDLIMIVVLAFEFYKPGVKQVRIRQVEGGEATITVDSIRQRLSFYIDGLQDVVSVTPRVKVKNNQVEVAVDIKTSAVVNVPSKAREVVAIIKMVVEETMGLELKGEPLVKIRTGNYQYVPARPAPLTIPAAAPEKRPEPVKAIVSKQPEPAQENLPAKLPEPEPAELEEE